MNIRPPNLNVNEMLKARHGSSARGMDITADTSYPRTEMSALMQSPCRPEENGYFGATYGIPSKLYYEFEIESRRGTDLSQAILVVEEHLMDVVLAVTFPTICSYEGDGRPPAKKDQDVVITGFRFGREELDLSSKYLRYAMIECDAFLRQYSYICQRNPPFQERARHWKIKRIIVTNLLVRSMYLVTMSRIPCSTRNR